MTTRIVQTDLLSDIFVHVSGDHKGRPYHMSTRPIILLFLLTAGHALHAQELFIQAEPASTMPAAVAGVRMFGQAYEEPGKIIRGLAGLKIMYGLTPRLTVMAAVTASNHHSRELPPEFPDHNTPQIGVHLPWRLNGVNLYAKYRLLSKDGLHTHFRVAAYGSASWLDVAHDEAEPDLLDDTKGIGGGFIATWLKKHFAVSATLGGILPATYKGEVPDLYAGLPAVPAKVEYGRALNYSLSFGYLLLPFKYKNYRQTNINLYAEFIGKSYEAGKVFLENIGSPGTSYQIQGAAVQVFNPNTYVELHPGIQAIIHSNLRIDFSAGFPLLSRSYTRFYPVYTLGIQRYFFPGK